MWTKDFQKKKILIWIVRKTVMQKINNFWYNLHHVLLCKISCDQRKKKNIIYRHEWSAFQKRPYMWWGLKNRSKLPTVSNSLQDGRFHGKICLKIMGHFWCIITKMNEWMIDCIRRSGVEYVMVYLFFFSNISTSPCESI